MDDPPPRSPTSPVRRAGAWLLGPPTTALLGGGLAAFLASRSAWAGAAVLALATLVATAGEAWGRRVGGDGPEWRPLRWTYVAVVLVATAVFVAATGAEFYLVTSPAIVFLPAVVQAGRGVHVQRAARRGRPNTQDQEKRE